MRTPCSFWAEVVAPGLRAMVARYLYERGMSQSEIAERLGITQAMVSKYIGGKYKKVEEIEAIIEDSAREIGDMILYGAPREEIIKYSFRRFLELLDGELCGEYLRYAGIDNESFCGELLAPSEDRSEVLTLLNLAVRELSRDELFPSLIPEVRSNFAYALPDARSIEDVAAIPGRITLSKGKVYALPAEFGASRHSASILLGLIGLDVDLRSVINIKYDERVEEALQKAGLRTASIEPGKRSEEETVKRIIDLFKGEALDAVVDEGGFGIEPVIYIFGKDPLDVLRKVKLLESFL
ncbi:thiamine-phosphate synthase family protein [Palaeococcus ferrophilus]|uniref:thiamine-phosphate synthase family protein n=1 Tax=Palaeococcus ferrophilus TaxID=83868 RepID=UPI00064ECE7A|nr:thiamine-phosphate synthase family protein [Palaeococcus ferrophilus]